MKKLKELLAEALGKGFATASEKLAIIKEAENVSEDEKNEVKDDMDKVSDLPEEAPETDEEVEKGVKALFEKAGKEVKESVIGEVKEWLKEQKELLSKGVGVYNKEVKANRKELNEYVRCLHKAIYGKISDAKFKEMTTDATGSPFAGYTVDSELSAEIRHLITEYGVSNREMFSVQLSKNSYKANNLVTDVTTYWVDEGAAIRSTQTVLGQETLELNKLAAIVTLTSELLEDTEIDLVSFITGRVSEGFAKMEDEAFFKGDGTSTYGSFTGLLNNTSVNEVTLAGTTFASMDADDLLAMIDATPQGAQGNAKFYMHRTIMSIVRKLKDTTNNYIYQRPSETGPATIWGYPVVLVEAMPSSTDTAVDTSFVLFGDLKKGCIYGFKGAIKAKMFDAGTVRNVANDGDINLITTDREALRWTRRVGFIVILASAITKLTTASASA